MKALGGYFGFEEFAQHTPSFHTNFYKFNTCRNALMHLLIELKVRTIHIPIYACDVLRNNILGHGIAVEYYRIDEHMMPDESSFNKNDFILYINYFGLMGTGASDLASRYPNLIVDNAQAFYDEPIVDVHTIYSPRKFFGMPDGGLLFTSLHLPIAHLELEASEKRCSHLALRRDVGPEDGYTAFLANERILDDLPIRKMSRISQDLLSQIDHHLVKKRRAENYLALQAKLESYNLCTFASHNFSAPLAYPLWIERGAELKKWLIDHRVFIPTYWPNVIENKQVDSLELRLVADLVCLPIDHRYSIADMHLIVKLIEEWRYT